MRVLIVNTDYPAFLAWLYGTNPGLADQPYDQQMQKRNESLFGVANFYSHNLEQLGHEAWDVHANNEVLQDSWAREHGSTFRTAPRLRKARHWAARTPLKYLKPALRPFFSYKASYDVLAEQIRHYRPDVLFNHAVDEIPDQFLKELRPHVKFIVGQIAAPLIAQKTFRNYDLLISSLPNFVEYFRRKGLKSELQRLAFEPSVLQRLGEQPRTTAVSFVGSFSAYHSKRIDLIEYLCNQSEIALWGQMQGVIPQASPIHKRYRGTAWGREMYQVLMDSKVTINHHIGIAENYANNMRLFEATGVGTMLLTDHKHNLKDMFEPGTEVAVYKSHEECLETIRYYMEHESERETIARAGQRRTLRDHNYRIRMEELMQLIRKAL